MISSLDWEGSWHSWAVTTLDMFYILRPKIEKALEYADNTHTFDDVCYLTFQGHFAWFASNRLKSMVLTEIHQFPRKQVVHGFLVCGELKDLTELLKSVMAYYTDKGYTHATMNGRQGWQKVMKRLGWEPTTVNLKYDVPKLDLFSGTTKEDIKNGWF